MSFTYSVELPERLAPSGPWLVHRWVGLEQPPKVK